MISCSVSAASLPRNCAKVDLRPCKVIAHGSAIHLGSRKKKGRTFVRPPVMRTNNGNLRVDQRHAGHTLPRHCSINCEQHTPPPISNKSPVLVTDGGGVIDRPTGRAQGPH